MRKVLCACGTCQELINERDNRGRLVQYKNGHQRIGKRFPNSSPKTQGTNHWNWKGGKTISTDGYIKIRVSDHPFASRGYIREHRYIMEKHLGRYLTKDEDVHHINNNRMDNRIDNLRLIKHNDHVTLHHHINRELRSKRL